MTIRFCKNLGFFLWLITFLASCATYTDSIKPIREDFTSGAYEKALSSLEELSLKEEKRNELLYLLEKGSLLGRLGQTKKSQKAFLAADRAVDRLYRASLAGEVASYLYNDSAKDYQGEDHEKVAIHTHLALSFLEDGQLQKARVEARAINTQLNEINNFYDENKNRYREDAFARLLAGLIYEAKKEWDSAIVEYRAALKIYEGTYKQHFDTPVPKLLVDSLYRLSKKRRRTALINKIEKTYKPAPPPKAKSASLIVIHEVGLIPMKTTEEFVFMWDGKPIRFSFPVIKRQFQSIYGRTGVTVNAAFASADLVQNLSQIARSTLEDARGRFTLKMGARVVLKDQIAQQAEKSFGIFGKLAAGIYGAVTETADTRSWTLLPSAYYVTRVPLKPGSYNVKITTNSRVSKLQKIRLKKGEVAFLRDY